MPRGGRGGGGIQKQNKQKRTDIHIQWTHLPSGSSRKSEFFTDHANYLTWLKWTALVAQKPRVVGGVAVTQRLTGGWRGGGTHSWPTAASWCWREVVSTLGSWLRGVEPSPGRRWSHSLADDWLPEHCCIQGTPPQPQRPSNYSWWSLFLFFTVLCWTRGCTSATYSQDQGSHSRRRLAARTLQHLRNSVATRPNSSG